MNTSITRRLTTILLYSSITLGASAQGIMIHDASTAGVLPLNWSHVRADIEDQVALVSSTQRFANTTADTLAVKYAYPLASSASATRVRWMLPDSVWLTASMVAEPQDTTLPGGGGGGGGVDPVLDDFLGESPLYFSISDPIPPGGWISVELSYVQLLPYAGARVELISASDYSALYSAELPELTIDVSIRSQRTLLGVDIAGTGSWIPMADAPYLDGDSANLHVEATDVPASCGFVLGYDLDPLAYGITCQSNYLPDSLIMCDNKDNGFFVLLIEPEPTSQVVLKDFVIVIDKSGSMSGTKITEAKEAAAFIVNNLNDGDFFNVIAFDSGNSDWTTGLQPYNTGNMLAALNWIEQVYAGGGTNINGAITEGMEDFNTSQPGHARSIVFLTDGQDQNPNEVILANAQQLRQAIAPDLQLFTFGIGTGYNEQLLNQLAVQNNGVSQFLEAANFADVMSEFYTQIQNPVLLSPVASFDVAGIQDILPAPLLGLYVGQQMVIVGRYDTPGPANLHLEGFASGSTVTMDFPFTLSGTFQESKLFVTKVWAQKAVEGLVNEYYSYDPDSEEAEVLRDSIVSYSMCYGIGSPFTSFSGDGGGTSVGVEEEEDAPTPGAQLRVFPEPSLAGSTVTFDLSGLRPKGRVTLRIHDALGRLLLEQDITAFCGGEWVWSGSDSVGLSMQGELIYHIQDNVSMWAGRLTRL